MRDRPVNTDMTIQKRERRHSFYSGEEERQQGAGKQYR